MLDEKFSAGASVAPTIPFLVLDENRFAFAAARRLQQRKPAPPSRLVYIHGSSGSGKTHLAWTFARDERRANPSVRLAHITAAQFAAELAQASKDKTIPEFQRRYRELGVLICEDLQGLERRHETQRQLVFVLDEILARGGRCLVTCNKAPGELRNVLPQLINRCRGGVAASVALPSETSRRRLVAHFAQTRQIPILAEASEILSRELAVSPRELLGSVVQLDAWARLKGAKVDRSVARRFLDGEVKPRSVTLPEIAQAVARHFGVGGRALRRGTRAHGDVLPRQCAMFLARQLTTEHLRVIAEYFGRKNHGTVLHACKRVELLAEKQAEIRRDLDQIRRSLAGDLAGMRV